VIKPLTNHRSYLYQQLADRIAALIEHGTLRPGDRVPSVRRLSTQHNVSVSSVLQAYIVLENRGLIEARPQSGYYVRPRFLAGLPEPTVTEPPLAAIKGEVGELVARLLRCSDDPGVVQLGSASPDPATLPTGKLNRILAGIARRAAPGLLDYNYPAGCADLRREIARRSLDWGCALDADEIITTAGCMDALRLCLRAVTKPGDTVAVESPTFFALLQLIDSLGLKTLQLSTFPRHGACLDALDYATRRHKVAAVVLTPNFQNPLGACMPDEKKQALVEMLARKSIPLIEDDVFGDLHHGPARPKVAKAFDKKELVLLCSSFSKTLAPGYRVGWAVPGRYRAQVELLKRVDYISGATILELAIAEFLKTGGVAHCLRQQRRAYARQMQQMIDAISEHFPTGTKVTRPTGGFLLWVELPGATNALDIHRAAAAHKINFAPGPLYSPKQAYRNCLRLSCTNPWSAKLEHALATLGQLAEKQR
jgi:DNA-binding transcriptional MocR family regulator